MFRKYSVLYSVLILQSILLIQPLKYDSYKLGYINLVPNPINQIHRVKSELLITKHFSGNKKSFDSSASTCTCKKVSKPDFIV